jgi:hypothetical protein
MKTILKDGTEIDGIVGKTGNFIEITISKSDAPSLLSKFLDPDVMSIIEYYSGAWKTVYTGFSRFSHMENPINDEMRVWMEGKEEAIHVEQSPRFDNAFMPKGG